MQGPRLASHHSGIELPDILPPNTKRPGMRPGFATRPTDEGQSRDGRKEEDLKGGHEDLEENTGGSAGTGNWLQRQKKLAMRHLAFIGPGEQLIRLGSFDAPSR